MLFKNYLYFSKTDSFKSLNSFRNEHLKNVQFCKISMNHRIWLNPHAVGIAAGVRDFLDPLEHFEIHEKNPRNQKKISFSKSI